MNSTDALRALKLFNEKAEKLANSSFTRDVFAEETGFTVSAKRGGYLTVVRRGPNEESIDAFVLTLRFFIQDNEPSSIRSVARIYESVLVSESLKERFLDCRRILNGHLDSRTHFKMANQYLTYREVLEAFLWGGLCHATPGKKDIYDAWIAMGGMAEIPRNILVVTLATFMNAIAFIHDLNAQVIVALGGTL